MSVSCVLLLKQNVITLEVRQIEINTCSSARTVQLAMITHLLSYAIAFTTAIMSRNLKSWKFKRTLLRTKRKTLST